MARRDESNGGRDQRFVLVICVPEPLTSAVQRIAAREQMSKDDVCVAMLEMLAGFETRALEPKDRAKIHALATRGGFVRLSEIDSEGSGECPVPEDVAVCPDCGGTLFVEASEWGESDRPMLHSLDIGCLDLRHEVEAWGHGSRDDYIEHQYDTDAWVAARDRIVNWVGAVDTGGDAEASKLSDVLLDQDDEEFGSISIDRGRGGGIR